MNRSAFALILSSLYLLLFLISVQLGYNSLTWILFLLSPLNILYLVYSVIRHGKYSGTELKDGEEWGYEDMDNNQTWR